MSTNKLFLLNMGNYKTKVEAVNDPKEHYKDIIYFGNVILSP